MDYTTPEEREMLESIRENIRELERIAKENEEANRMLNSAIKEAKEAGLNPPTGELRWNELPEELKQQLRIEGLDTDIMETDGDTGGSGGPPKRKKRGQWLKI